MTNIIKLGNDFADVKGKIFGEVPEEGTAERVGYNLAFGYFPQIIQQVEPVLQGLIDDDGTTQILLTNAFEYADVPLFQKFPAPAVAKLKEIAGRFKKRYDPLQQKLQLL